LGRSRKNNPYKSPKHTWGHFGGPKNAFIEILFAYSKVPEKAQSLFRQNKKL